MLSVFTGDVDVTPPKFELPLPLKVFQSVLLKYPLLVPLATCWAIVTGLVPITAPVPLVIVIPSVPTSVKFVMFKAFCLLLNVVQSEPCK